MQFPTTESAGEKCAAYAGSLQEASGAASDIVLPLSYSEIKPCILPSKEFFIFFTS